MIQIGDTIPDFEMSAYYNDEITRIKLSDYRGKWLVLVFYPADFTFVCPTELSELADLYDDFKAEGAEVMSVSTDTAYVHKAWHDSSESIAKIKYPMLADPGGKLCREMGTYIESEGLSLRGSFIIDPNGVLKALEMNDNDIGRSGKELLRKLQAAVYISGHTGEVCPASWQPGAKTLTPGINLVGKI
ncbi:MAG TPA: redoxin domain-containing protein [Firmicutes bacterium]|nr:redoxin domain-containing protein [Bacillota bacterium]